MKKIILFALLSIALFSCNKSSNQDQGAYPCLDGNCNGIFSVSTDTISIKDNNGYYHVKYVGYNYFTVNGDLSKLTSDYIINGEPLIETGFDSDYWVFFDTIRYRYPVYSFLGVYSNKQYNDPIPIGNRTYTLVDIDQLYPPLNIAGYTIPKKFTGWDKPYAVTMIGTYSKYNYHPTQNMFLNKDMIGDTAHIFIKVTFNTDLGNSIVKNYTLSLIFN
jgi:hypothetical protein